MKEKVQTNWTMSWMLVAVCQTNQIYKCVRCTKLITDNIVLNEMSVVFSLLELKLFMLFTGKFWENHSSSFKWTAHFKYTGKSIYENCEVFGLQPLLTLLSFMICIGDKLSSCNSSGESWLIKDPSSFSDWQTLAISASPHFRRQSTSSTTLNWLKSLSEGNCFTDGSRDIGTFSPTTLPTGLILGVSNDFSFPGFKEMTSEFSISTYSGGVLMLAIFCWDGGFQGRGDVFENFEDGGRFDARKLRALPTWFALISALVPFSGTTLIWNGLFNNGGFELGGIKRFWVCFGDAFGYKYSSDPLSLSFRSNNLAFIETFVLVIGTSCLLSLVPGTLKDLFPSG